MYRKLSLNGDNKDKLTLYKNSREEIAEIPNEYIETISYKHLEPSVIKIKIPNKTIHNGKTVLEPLFDKLLGKRQKMVLNDKYVFVVTDCDRNDTKDVKYKEVIAKTSETILNDFELYIPQGGYTRHLNRVEGEIEISDGILDIVLDELKGWSLGYIDEDVRKRMDYVTVEFDKTITSFTVNDMAKDTVLFDVNYNDINPNSSNDYIELRISYKNVQSHDKTTNKLLKTEKIINNVGIFHTGIKRIKASITSTDEHRYAIKYEIILTDDTTSTKVCEFLDLVGYNVIFGGVTVLYTNGEMQNITSVQYRSFEEGVYKILDFLMTGVSEAFDCVFTFDTIAKKINCYAKKNFGENKGVYLSYDNFIKGINKNYQYDDIITKLEVSSEQEGVAIREENPLGTDFLLDYSYFIDNGIMSEECSKAWQRYVLAIDGVQVQLYNLRTQLSDKNKLKIKLETEMYALQEEIKGLEVIRVAYIKANDTVNVARISAEINSKQDRVNAIMTQLQSTKDAIATLSKQISEIVTSIRLESASDSQGKIFTETDLEELTELTIVGNYTDKYYLTNYALFENSKIMLAERNKLQIDFSIDTVGLLQNLIIPKGESWDYLIALGDFINVDDTELDNVRLVGIEYSPKEGVIKSLSFTNKDKEIDDLKGIGNIGRTISRVDNYTSNYRGVWNNSMLVNKYVDSVLTDGMDARATAIRSRSGRCKFDMTEAGLFVIDAYDEKQQIYVGSGMICITNDRWQTVRTAIDSEGLVAKEIVGQIILGKSLHITSESGEFYVGNMNDTAQGFGLSIKDGGNTQRIFLGTELVNGVRKARLRLIGSNGEVALSEDGIINHNQFVVWDNVSSGYPMRIPFKANNGVMSFKNVTLTLYFDKYRAFERGISSGGSTVSSASGGGATTTASGGGSLTSASGGGATTTASGGGTLTSSGGGYFSDTKTSSGWTLGETGGISTGFQVNFGTTSDHYHMVPLSSLTHTHTTQIQIPSHTHSVDTAHSHTVASSHTHTIDTNHTHTINSSHTHNVDTTHTHALEYNIFEQNSMPSNVRVYVNNTLVKDGINSDGDVDITSHINLNATNNIRIETDSNGRLIVNVNAKSFVGW